MKAFNDLTSDELNILYNNFVVYRDKICNGWAKISVIKFYSKYGLNPYE